MLLDFRTLTLRTSFCPFPDIGIDVRPNVSVGDKALSGADTRVGMIV